MTKKEYWQAHVAKNPKFENEETEIKISVKMLRRLMEEAYDKGFEHNGKQAEVFKNLFKNIKI